MYFFFSYFWVTCPSDFFLGSEGPKAAASAGSLVRGMRHLVRPHIYTTERDLHTSTHKASRFTSQGIQHSTNVGLASSPKFLSIQPWCSNPWACHSKPSAFPDNKSLPLDYWPILLNENGSMAWPKKIIKNNPRRACIEKVIRILSNKKASAANGFKRMIWFEKRNMIVSDPGSWIP